MSDVIDMLPALRRKKRAECKHASASVDMSAASLTCDACDAELDPWWYLRQLAREPERYQAWWDEQKAAHDAWLAKAQAFEVRTKERCIALQAEYERLVELKNRLWNEQIDGRPLGTYAMPRRRKVNRAGGPAKAAERA